MSVNEFPIISLSVSSIRFSFLSSFPMNEIFLMRMHTLKGGFYLYVFFQLETGNPVRSLPWKTSNRTSFPFISLISCRST